MTEPKIDVSEKQHIVEAESEEGILAVGTVIDGKYQVVSRIGKGGMGEVYKVSAVGTQTYFALKMLCPALAAQRLIAKRLENEAMAARTLAHGNIVSVYDVGESSGAPYLVMDYIEGESLDVTLKRDAVFTQERALQIFIQIAEALVHARQKSVIHRDLKPSNIILTKTDGGADLIKIVDFGIAKISDQQSEDKTKLTQTGELLGTPLYMSPEQCRGDEIDSRSDIYSFGCIMYEMLVGKPPFAAENQVKVILKHLSDDRPKVPSGLNINPALKEIINRCLEKERCDRYDNAVTLQIDLERVLDGKPLQPHRRRFRINDKRNAPALAAVVVIALCLIGFTTALMIPHSAVNNATIAPPPVVQNANRPETYKDKTLSQWTEEIEAHPDDPTLYFSRGELHSMRDERTNAIDDFTQAIDLKPNYLQAYSERCVQYDLIASYDKAEKDANKIIELNPQAPDGYESKGWVLGSREQYAESIEAWRKAISIDDNPYYHYHLATNLLKLARYDEAYKEIEIAINNTKSGAYLYRGIAGVISTFRQDFPTAKRQFEAAVEDNSARGVEWQEFAYYYVCIGDMPKAEQAIQQAKAMETFPARAYRLAGELYRTAGKFDTAIQQFSASTSLEEYPPGYRERAITYIDMKQWRSAYDDLKKSLQLNPYSITTLSYSAMVESHLGMQDKAAQHIDAAFRAKAIPAIIYANRAAINLNKHDLNSALADADKAKSIDPFLKEGYSIRAQIHKSMNDANAAQADQAKADKLVSHLDL